MLLSLRQRIEAKEPAPLIDEIVQRLARIPAVVLYPAWSDALKQASSQPRIRLLDIIADWMPVLVALGGATAADETFQAIDNVSHWWP